MILTLKRSRLCALVTLVIGSVIALSQIHSNKGFLEEHTDFSVFYNAGRILNAHGDLYDRDIQERLYIDLVPSTTPHSREIRFYAYSPFFALIFAPLARLHYSGAFTAWALICLSLFTAAFLLIWSAAQLPNIYRLDSFVIAVSFLPFYAWCALSGQTSAVGLFSIALSIYFERNNKELLSGLALSLLLYKPPLLLFFIPMFLITKRWRILLGFVTGAITLAAISLAVIGFSGVPSYFRMLGLFAKLKALDARRTWLEIDLYSQLVAFPYGRAMFVVFLGVAAAFLVKVWRGAHTFPLTVTATLALNLYMLLYDATLIIAAVILTAAELFKKYGTTPSVFRWLVLILFLAPWFEINLKKVIGLQPVTFALLAFGIYQIRLANRKTQTVV